MSLIRRSTSDAQTLKTDANGMITFKTGPADYYLLRAKPTTDEKVEGQYDKTNYEATMTFTVQKGTNMIPAENVNPLPLVYVNGELADAGGIENKNGSLYVDAGFIRNYINNSYEGSGQTALRATVESSGAAVEWLAPVGGMRAAVHIYTSK